ncbi:MAG: EamA family transporter [Patescibacteria group bacterium]|jgi:drug/metabolite transporter (DMT)-like permease
MSLLGVILALVALLAWGFGDFFIQRSARALGVWESLFAICLFGAVVLAPFILPSLMALELTGLIILLVLSVVLTFAALFDFSALKDGKLAVVEPLLGLELPLTVALGAIFIGENLDLIQLLLILVIFIGIVLAVTVHHHYLFYHRRLLERGVILAGLGAVTMALANFLTGLGSRETSPLLVIWFTNVFITLVCLVYLGVNHRFRPMFHELKKKYRVVLAQCVFDNLAWIAFAAAMVLIPIGVATAISESYIVLTVILGIFVNREKLKTHQVWGSVVAAGGVVVLAALTALR